MRVFFSEHFSFVGSNAFLKYILIWLSIFFSGEFSEAQKVLYDIVLDCQETLIKSIVPYETCIDQLYRLMLVELCKVNIRIEFNTSLVTFRTIIYCCLIRRVMVKVKVILNSLICETVNSLAAIKTDVQESYFSVFTTRRGFDIKLYSIPSYRVKPPGVFIFSTKLNFVQPS